MFTLKYSFYVTDQFFVTVSVWFEPTDLSRAFRPFQASPKWRSALAYASPNLNELRVMHNIVFGKDYQLSAGPGDNLEQVLDESLKLGVPLLDGQLHTLIVTLGPHGVLLITNLPSEIPFPTGQETVPKDKVRALHYSAPKPGKIVSVSGAGDCFAAGMIGSILNGLNPEDCVRAGQRAALLSLSSHLAVPDSINPETIFSRSKAMSSISVLL
ncbi:pfkB domain-containing protein [Nephila pilipes]|uniref:PfkB domain-containing protein n=1 Tax=Nephila pilipes TaxID=299642 RepID=A0A8X6UBB3_NEPPI|nr:pfkB domain-containing protein [Nephila pilipes]GFU12669.1 pfkB domain-containing protein [Nephila pilipes]